MEAYGLSNVLIEEILSRLPAKSLLRFKCVSKIWYGIITSSYFAKLHLKRLRKQNYPENNALFIVSSTSTHTSNVEAILMGVSADKLIGHQFPTEIGFDFDNLNHNDKSLSISESSNGLFCLSYTSTSRRCRKYMAHGDRFVLYNPATGAFKHLPTLPIPAITIEFSRHSSFKSSSYFGFGHDHVSDDYKVIRVVEDSVYRYWYCERHTEMHIYSLKNKSWLKIEYPRVTIEKFPGQRVSGALSNNALHWLSDYTNKIIGIDLHSGKYSELPGPNFEEANNHHVSVRFTCLDGRGGCLNLTVVRREFNEVHEFWRMNKYGEKNSWIKYLRVKLSKLSPWLISIHPIAFTTRCGRQVVAFVGELCYCRALKLFYQTPKGRVSQVKVNDDLSIYNMIPFTPSLLSFDHKFLDTGAANP